MPKTHQIKKKISLLSLLFLFCSNPIVSQNVSVVNATFNEYNASISGLSQITLSSSIEGKVRIEAIITNVSNVTLLKLVSSEVIVKKGITSLNNSTLKYTQVAYTNHPQADYMKTFNQLPSGIFNYCISVIPLQSIEEGDDYCQSIDATEKEQLYLINPADEDEIETSTPILIWFHSEPFNLLNQGEFFRVILVELNENQSASSGITANIPYFIKNNLTKHQIQYPFDAKPLEYGKRYAWQVQKIANGNIISTTEAWEFSLPKKNNPTDFKYVYLKEKIDGSIYNVQNDRIYFKYDERYVSTNLICKIISDKREEIKPEVEDVETSEEGVKQIGSNKYELDLKPYKLKKGYYILEVRDEKNSKYQLKFYIDK
jgi:hypothetical protein